MTNMIENWTKTRNQFWKNADMLRRYLEKVHLIPVNSTCSSAARLWRRKRCHRYWSSSGAHCHSVWKLPKRSHSNCEQSELRLLFEWTKIIKIAKNGQFSDFLITQSLRSNSATRQLKFNGTKKLWKLPKFKCDILSHFQTLCMHGCQRRKWKVPLTDRS